MGDTVGHGGGEQRKRYLLTVRLELRHTAEIAAYLHSLPSLQTTHRGCGRGGGAWSVVGRA